VVVAPPTKAQSSLLGTVVGAPPHVEVPKK